MSGRLKRMLSRLAGAYREGGLRGLLATARSYGQWRLHGRPTEAGSVAYEDWVAAYRDARPGNPGGSDTLFSIICPVYDTPPDLLQECCDSVIGQTYGKWELLLVDDASNRADTRQLLEGVEQQDGRIRVITRSVNGGISAATNDGIAEASGTYLVFLDHDDRLVLTALEWIATCTPEADLVYTDEDKIDETGKRFAPFFKPAWSPRLLLGVNYLNHITCIRTDLVRQAGGLRSEFDGAQDHDLLLRLSDQPLNVAHIPHVLYHWRAWDESVAGMPSSKLHVEQRGIRAIQQAIDRRKWNATAGLGNGSPFNYRVHWKPLGDPPLVKIVIPTRDRVGLLKRALEGVFNRTDGVDVHVVIVDNGSVKPKTMDYLEYLVSSRDDVTVTRIDDAFNYSRLCNEGVRCGPETDYVLLLNNDVEVLHRRWLLQLSGWLRDPQVVGVGPKLRFSDGTIQHAGVILGFGGIAGHYGGYMPDHPQLGNLHDQAREVACLTAACLLVRKRAFEDVRGFDERYWNGYEDIDLCFKLQEKGGKLVYNPESVLIHHESVSGPERFSKIPKNISLLHQKWLGKIKPDLVVEENGEVQKTKTERIEAYQIPEGHSQGEL
ncbi:MAG: glycosyltransferase family 2 protein, partial [Acidimicrobiia bacterium]